VSIQNRLLLIYTAIFTTAFLIFAGLVFYMPRNRILSEIDTSLEAIAQEFRVDNVEAGDGNVLRVPIPQYLANFETASTFILIVDVSGQAIIARSGNMNGVDGLLDPEGLDHVGEPRLVRQGTTLLRVLTAPIYLTESSGEVVAYLQVARLLDFYESFNKLIFLSLLIGMAAATGSLFLAVWLTPSLFKPLDDIAAVAGQITRADDLSRRVPDTGRTDEIGILARALNQTLERLERLFETQQRLLADVSHELRTPLTAMRGNIDLMRRMGQGDPESLDILQEEVGRMTRLVGDLMLLARADSGGLPLHKKLLELDNLFFDVYRQARVIEKNVEVSVTAVDQVCVFGDPDRLKQLFLNLVDNAIKYTPAGGEVRLRLYKQDGWAYFEVSDTGIGIPQEDLPHIFDRFYRVDKARSRAQGGSGLGLSIAKWVAKAHDGDILVESEVNVGTTFTVKLPAYSSEEEKPEKDGWEETPTRPSLRSFISRDRNSVNAD